MGNKLPLGDGVDVNDVPFRATFPYVAPPHAGSTRTRSASSRRTTRTPAQP